MRPGLPQRRLIWAGAALLGIALIALDARGVAIQYRLHPSAVSPEQGHAYVAPIRVFWPLDARADIPTKGRRSVARLLEDGRPLGPASSAHDAIRREGGGRFSHWRRSIYFSTSDGTDPRANGRDYRVALRLHLAPTARGLLWIVVVFAVAGVLSPFWQPFVATLRPVAAPDGAREVRAGRRELLALCALLAPVPLLVLVLCAPFVSVDGSVVLTAELNDFVVPHFPPLYPVLVRAIHLVVRTASVLVGLAPTGAELGGSLVRPPAYSDASLWAVVGLQNVLLVVAAAAFALSISRRWWLRVMTGAALAWNPSLLAPAQRVQTEGLWHPLVLLALAFAVRYLTGRGRWRRDLALHFAAIGLGMLVRHPGAVLLAVLPLAWLSRGVAATARDRELAAGARSWRAAVAAVVLGVATLAAVSLTQRATMVALHIEPRSVHGRAGLYRLQDAYLDPFEQVTPVELQRARERIQERAADDATRRAVQIIGETTHWVDPFNRIRSEIVEPAQPESDWYQAVVATDRVLNSVARLVYTSTDRTLLRGVFYRALRFLHLGPVPADHRAAAGRVAESTYLREGPLAELHAARSRPRLERYGALEWLHQVWTRPLLGKALWLAIAALGLAVFVRRRADPRTAAGLAIVVTAITYAFLMAMASVIVFRYLEVMIVLQISSAALFAAATIDSDPAAPRRRNRS